MMSTLKLCLAGSLFLLVSCAPRAQIDIEKARVQSITLIAPQGQEIEIQAEIADSAQLRARGLMYREELANGNGMLFIFDRPNILLFWMKNTLISLDIIFFDAEGLFVKSATMDPCGEEPCRVYNSEDNALYALEVPAGYVQRMGIGEGWRLEYVLTP